MPNMGFQYGLDRGVYCKRSFRWIFEVPGVCADPTPGVNALPPERSARPTLSFKEMEARHLNEDIYYPAKPEWRPVTLTLYDLQKSNHPVFEWLRLVYDPRQGNWKAPICTGCGVQPASAKFIKDCYLTMVDAVGYALEIWVFQDAWLREANFQTLDMSQSSIMTCELTLRYARAFILTADSF